MRKIFSTMMLVAAAAMAFVSCQKNEYAPKYEQTVLTFASTNPNTKTAWNGETIIWSAGDSIRMALKIGDSWYADANDKVKYYDSKDAYLSDDSQIAQFEISGSFDTSLSGNYQFYALYPSSCTGSSTDFTKVPNATYTIASEQLASSQTFDKSADILWGKAVKTYTYLPKGEQISLMWNRMVAHAYITLKGLPAGETINKVTLTAQDGVALVGKYDVDITTGAVSENTPANSVVVNCEAVTVGQDGSASFWACINPCTLTELDITVDTDKAVYTTKKTGFSREFKVNQRNVLPINMSEANREGKVTNGAALPFEETFAALAKGDHNGTGTSALSTELPNFIIPSGASLYEANGAIRLAKSGVEGSLTTIPLDLSSAFYVKVKAKGWDSDEVKLTVKAGSQSQDINLITYNPGDFVEYVVNFDAVDNSESVVFSTGSGVRVFIDEIEIGSGAATAAPMIVAQTPAKVSANGGTGEIAYTVYNEIDGINLTASSNQSWLTINSTIGGKVAFKAAANDVTEERTATVTLTYGTVTKVVTVTQDKKASTDAVYYVKVTENVNDLSGTYLWVCEEKSVAFAGIGSDYYADLASISISDGKIESNATTDQYQIVITKSGSNYLIKYGDKYVAYNTSTKFKPSTSDTDNASKWNITINSNEAAITSVSAPTRHVYWSTTSGNCFALYESKSSYKYVQLYKLQSN